MSLLDNDAFPRGGGGDEVDELAYRLHRHTTRSCQSRGQGLPIRCHPILLL
jgi:hypothetical protein